jgi:hypothetical protein
MSNLLRWQGGASLPRAEGIVGRRRAGPQRPLRFTTLAEPPGQADVYAMRMVRPPSMVKVSPVI